MLEVSSLVVDHGKLRALWDVSFRVEKGQRVGLLGANGAGKSTTLGAIIGLYPAVSGDVRYQDRSITDLPTPERVEAGIALVPEGRRLFPEMTVRENLEMGAYTSRPRRRLDAALDRVFALFPVLAEKRNQQAQQLSGGQQQMVAIGRALMSEPALILFDEPFLGVAPIIVEEVLAVLRRISEEGVTMLLVEQNIHRALDFVDSAYVVENGRTVLDGTREELLGDEDFSSKFLGLD